MCCSQDLHSNPPPQTTVGRSWSSPCDHVMIVPAEVQGTRKWQNESDQVAALDGHNQL